MEGVGSAKATSQKAIFRKVMSGFFWRANRSAWPRGPSDAFCITAFKKDAIYVLHKYYRTWGTPKPGTRNEKRESRWIPRTEYHTNTIQRATATLEQAIARNRPIQRGHPARSLNPTQQGNAALR